MSSLRPFTLSRLARLPVLMPAAAFLLLAMASSLRAQVLVYRIEYSNNHGVNYNTFNGGYFAAPLLGGTGSFLLTSDQQGLTFLESDSSGTLFTAVSSGGQKTAVVSATTGAGTTTTTTTTGTTGTTG